LKIISGFETLMCCDTRHAITEFKINKGVSLTFSAGWQLLFTGGQTSFDVNISRTKTFL